MTILAIDTSFTACSAAVLLPGAAKPIQRFEPMARGHAEELFPMIEAVMAEADCDFRELTKIAVTLGPGSFTGVRAGIAAARGIALAAGLPMVGATSLEVMARGCARRLDEDERKCGFAVMYDARRGELYVQHFAKDGVATGEPRIMDIVEAFASLPPSIALAVGSGAVLAAQEAQCHGRPLSAALLGLLPEAGDLAVIAIERSPSGEPVSPLYLRLPDAKPQSDKILARAT
jgi:tRNA threonylcarbamoyladenosine biosynthesis protein TsaB